MARYSPFFYQLLKVGYILSNRGHSYAYCTSSTTRSTSKDSSSEFSPYLLRYRLVDCNVANGRRSKPEPLVRCLNVYHASVIEFYYRMDTSKAPTRYKLAGRMESILRAHSV